MGQHMWQVTCELLEDGQQMRLKLVGAIIEK
jgi:hypothetical protein